MSRYRHYRERLSCASNCECDGGRACNEGKCASSPNDSFAARLGEYAVKRTK